MKVKLIRKDHNDPTPFEPVIFDVGKYILGRASPLNCVDKNISRKHCTLEVHSDGTAELASTHINPTFYFRPTSSDRLILKKGESVILKNDDLISLLPDSFLFYVSFITGDVEENNDSGNTSQTDMEAETQEVLNEDKDRDSSTKEQTNARINTEGEGETTLNPTDTELLLFDGFDDEIEEEKDIPSPSLLDEATPSVLKNNTSEKRELTERDAESTMDPSPKRHRPNSPEDIKPNISELQALVSTEPATSSVNDGPQDVIAPVKVKTEAHEGAANVKVKTEDSDGADSNNAAVAGGSDDKAKPATNRTKCSFGTQCYRKNPQHRNEYAHPGDPEWATPTPCQWGAACYRQNPQHRSIFTHPGPPAPRPVPQQAQGKKKPTRNVRKKRPSWSGSDTTDEYDTEDPFLAADSSDDYNPSSDSWSSGESDEGTKEGQDEDSQNTKRENRRLLREAKRFTAKK